MNVTFDEGAEWDMTMLQIHDNGADTHCGRRRGLCSIVEPS